jgi:hypothetical protein
LLSSVELNGRQRALLVFLYNIAMAIGDLFAINVNNLYGDKEPMLNTFDVIVLYMFLITFLLMMYRDNLNNKVVNEMS